MYRGLLEYVYEMLLLMRDSPTNLNQKQIYLRLVTTQNKMYKALKWLEKCGLVRLWRGKRRSKIPKPTALGLNWLITMEQLMEEIDYKNFREEFREWSNHRWK